MVAEGRLAGATEPDLGSKVQSLAMAMTEKDSTGTACYH